MLSLKWRGSLFDYLRGQFSEVVILGVAVEYEDMFRAGWSEVGDCLDLAHVAADRIGDAVLVVDLHVGVSSEHVTTIQDGEHLFFKVSELGLLKGCPDWSV